MTTFYATVLLFSVCYACGESSQWFFPEAPRWVRWYLSDVGFPSFYGLMLALAFRQRDAEKIMQAIWWFWMVALLIEIEQQCMWDLFHRGSHADVLDVVCSTSSVVVVYAAYLWGHRFIVNL
jgi:hypothetical protein